MSDADDFETLLAQAEKCCTSDQSKPYLQQAFHAIDPILAQFPVRVFNQYGDGDYPEGLEWQTYFDTLFNLLADLEQNSLTLSSRLHRLGMLFYRNYAIYEAEQLLWRSYKIRTIALGEEESDLIPLLSDLACVRTTCAVEGAEATYIEAAELAYKEVFRLSAETSIPPEQIAKLKHDYALCLSRQKRFQEAEHSYQEALILKKELWGVNHKETYRTVVNLGLHFFHLANYESATPYFHEALTIARAIEDPDAIGQGSSLLGDVYRVKDKTAQARQAYTEAIEAWMRICPDDIPMIVDTLASLKSLPPH